MLIECKVITLEGGGGMNRVMISFYQFNLCKCKRQLYANI